eukprot:4745062-Alexandrium_andersonii.AAC.1
MPTASQDQAGRARVTTLEADAKSRCFVVADGEVGAATVQAALLEQFQAEADLMEVLGEAEGTNGQRLMVRVADKRGQRAAQRLTAAGRLRLPAGYAK